VVAQPIGVMDSLDAVQWQQALDEAQRQAGAGGIRGKALTPFLLTRVAALTGGKTLLVNQKLVVANAKLAAQVASLLAQMTKT
jgi:pseudouridylate synthase